MTALGVVLALALPVGLLVAITALALQKPVVNRLCYCGACEACQP